VRLAADAGHGFGGVALDRSKPLEFKLDRRTIAGFAGDTVLSAVLAAGIDTYGRGDDTAMALTDSFAPSVSIAGAPDSALAMERTLVAGGMELSVQGRRSPLPAGAARSLRLRIRGAASPAWMHGEATSSMTADLAIIGGGLAGLAAAEAAITAGRTVVLVERRTWLGGDADYFGTVGEDEPPEAIAVRLSAALTASPNATVLLRADAFQIVGQTVHVHQVDAEPAGARMLSIKAQRILLATGAPPRLPLFAGNRLPGVVSALTAHHLAKRYGVALGKAALVATQSNFAYRLALHLHDAGVVVERIVDTRVNPQSRFIDFAKASGLKLSTGQRPVAAAVHRRALAIDVANVGGSGGNARLETPMLVVSGAFQPDLSLWMLAGGMVQWADGRLMHTGPLEHVGIAGSAAGWRSHQAVVASGRATQAALFGGVPAEIRESEVEATFETPDAATPIAPTSQGVTFLDHGRTLVRRPASSADSAFAASQALGPGDVAAAVDLGLISGADAGAIAEERGAPGADLVPSGWRAPPRSYSGVPPFLAGRFGDDAVRRHLVVDETRAFAAGALVHLAGSSRDPLDAVGVVIETASPGGVALLAATPAAHDRFIVETLEGPSPARVRPS